jgi:hypothetical protein
VVKNRRWLGSVKATFLSALLLSGCSADPGKSAQQITKPTADELSTTAVRPAQGPSANRHIRAMNSDLQSIVRSALEDAARRTGVDASALKVVSSEAVTWPDGALGCPEPGVMYTMALVPGYRIRIKAGDNLLDYHASRRGFLVLCPPERSVDPVPGGPT